MLRSTRVLRDVCSGAYVPGAGNPGFSKIIEGPSGPGCAPRRRAGGACPGSAAIRRQAYPSRGVIVGPQAAFAGAGVRTARSEPAPCALVEKCAGATATGHWLEQEEKTVRRTEPSSVQFRTGGWPVVSSPTTGGVHRTGCGTKCRGRLRLTSALSPSLFRSWTRALVRANGCVRGHCCRIPDRSGRARHRGRVHFHHDHGRLWFRRGMCDRISSRCPARIRDRIPSNSLSERAGSRARPIVR